ncbi:MAG: bifunctional (p)ppGpp synthetase/guanosine-3',5'-bis(diphosphate) 3'-pyrophosphohydrolase, partial [Lachnospiraceae bacterium]|nr:bifunctional (p)ppGpp synthetase/guanosine-3',5'-bis(diphosphate) 3'-pyrophosphohydrolase [Lachnospiraceae bacterium]
MENNNIKIEDLISSVRKANRRANVSLIIKAYKYANAHHTGQSRASGVPYIVHPLNVALILTELHLDDATICAALLHDVVEDTPITKEDIIKEFGLEISEMVEGVTKLSKLQYSDKEERQVEDYRKMFLAMGKDIRVILIKLADRLHNMRTLKYIPEDRQLANARETMNLYAPLANRLGIYSIKWELEDLSFKYLYPEEYRELVEGINKKREERLEFIEEITGELKMGLRKERIQGEVTGRAKHLYSIYRKMKRDNVSLDQIYDLFALRILVNTVKDCYAALGIVHELYTPMPGRFKDYIAVPKPNMYQSIHTTVLGKGESPFEIQIRTWEMHQVAETGIAAHWAYKEANKDRKSNVVVVEDKLAWLRETLEWQKDMQDPNEFLARLKTELFEDEVYVFTPRGQIKVLPKGATPIDFAYNIHAEVGHKMVGCKINSKMMPIVTSLNNGDIVEIITSDTSKGPSRDWLKFVKSGSAKNRILQWFKKTQKEENIVKGKDLLDKEIRRIGMSHSDLYRTEWVQIALDRYKFVNQDEMFASIGFGAMSPAKIIAKLLEEYKKEHKEEILEEKIQELSKSKPVQNKNTKTGIIVKGIDNCLVKLSKCCNPLPGDNIVGYITKGRGVSVHRTDCINVNDLLQEEGRMIDVYWYEDKKSLYSVDIQTLATDRIGLVADTLKEMANTKAKITAISCKTDKYGIDTTDLTVEVENLNEL